MLTIFRRHTKECMERHHGRDPGRSYRRCKCPIHAEGHLGGVMHRKALDTTSWTRAQDIVRDKEARGTWHDPSQKGQVPVADAIGSFLQALTAQSSGKAKSTTRKIRVALLGVNPEWRLKTQRKVSGGLLDFCRDNGITTVDQLSVLLLTKHAASWTCGPRHRSKRIQLLRRFFRFCIAAEWLEKNPALSLDHPKGRAISVRPKQPFDAQHLPEEGPEWKAIMQEVRDQPKLLALTLLMRSGGLRISDAVTFHRNRLMADGSIFLYMSKTNEPVSVPVHPELRAALEVIQPNAAGYYFWSGASEIATAADNWRVRFAQIFKRAGIQGGHPHRFRDTFAVDLLLRGVPIDQVSLLLGHSSVTVTERYYLAFVAARREQIANSVRRAWADGTGAQNRLAG
jgi:integrase/recombinase XerD